jgi:hypothetical protein
LEYGILMATPVRGPKGDKMSIARRNDERIEADEAELLAMMEAERGTPKPETVKEPTQEAEPKAAPVEDDDNLSESEKTWKKRHGDLRRHAQKEKTELTNRLAELERRLNEAPSTASPVTKEDVIKWSEDNPKAAAIIKALALEESGSKFQELDKLTTEINKEKGESRILKAHPDFYDITEDDAFHEWADNQPSFIQDRIYDNNDPDETIWAISLYKKESGKQKVSLEREAARGVKAKAQVEINRDPGKGRFTESMVEAMSVEEYEANMEQINKDRKHKDFYDLSAGAR